MSISSCSDGEDEGGKIVGLWKETSADYTVLVAGTNEVLSTEPIENNYPYTYKFEKDGTCTSWYRGLSNSRTYDIANNKLFLYGDGGVTEYFIKFNSDKQMVLYYDHSPYMSDEYGKEVVSRWSYYFDKEL